ncbi:H-type lectin domain-containing protein [Elsinoe australis]|uniref:H-type lectin domain-containing protein n=1 Tax=Elsinoe australis TaxID=40998 RepID=A0A4V6DVB7_9PEZI|nr:H-type lectin domain-containing protein [Elsinoe australis]
MVHLSKPGPDTGQFHTTEVRSSNKPSKSTSRIVALPSSANGPHYQTPPNLAAGFNSLHLSHEHPARANLTADGITTTQFKITVETWGPSILYSGGATWIEHKRNARDCLFGQFDTSDLASSTPSASNSQSNGTAQTNGTSKAKDSSSCPQENSKHIRFPRAFASPPQVICWLNRLDLTSSPEHNYRLRSYATHTTKSGFTAHIDTWSDTQLNGAAMCWIAFPQEKALVASGDISTLDVRSWSDPREETSGEVRFGKKFRAPPTVLVALNMLDAAGNADLRVAVKAQDVTGEGFKWTFSSGGDSTLYAAGGSWIALGFV